MGLELEGFSRVDALLFKVAMPYYEEHIDFLRSKGISEIISLRPLDAEIKKYAGSLGISVHYLPGLGNLYSRPEIGGKVLENFFGLVAQLELSAGKALIHCDYGADRTDFAVSLYRAARGIDAVHSVQGYKPEALRVWYQWILDGARKKLLRQRKVVGARPMQGRKTRARRRVIRG